MTITFNHTIVYSADRSAAASFFTELFGLPPAKKFGKFLAVGLNHGFSLDFSQIADGTEVAPQHYAFLVSEDEFTAIYGQICERGLQHWADPRRGNPGKINHRDGGRGVYFPDPSGHYLEIITRPYGSGG
jgi:catechol 2,3-dioxygenase-like lactoylglutathione lyase family enzyme